MILFNSIFSQVTPEFSRGPVVNCKHASIFLKSSTSVSKSFALAYIVKDPAIISVSTSDLAKRNFVKQSRYQKILNSIWHQVIFLSIPGKSYDKYVVDLSYLNNYKPQGANRHLISEFSQSLLQGSVSSSLSDKSGLFLSHPSSVQYGWRKGLKGTQQKVASLFRSNVYHDHLDRVKQYLYNSDCINHFPLFAVSNNLGQMIISEPPSELAIKRSVTDYMTSSNNGNLCQGWFFASFEDAKEYMETIREYYNLRKEHLKIFACNFNTFYMITDRLGDKVHFRLLPDLTELGNLTKSYRRHSNISFHASQKHGRNYFQGQPLYILNVKDLYKEDLAKHGFKLFDQYKLAFSSYDTACSAWSKVSSYVYPGKSVKPDLLVYNLESLIADESLKTQAQADKFLLVPSESTYRFVKEHFLQKKINLLHGTALNYAASIRLWSKRVLWSLTSKQPCGW